MAKQRKHSDSLPDDWRQRLEERIQKTEISTTPIMLRLIQEERPAVCITEAASILWRASDGRPDLRDNFYGIMCIALYKLAVGLSLPPYLTWTSRECREFARNLKEAKLGLIGQPEVLSALDAEISAYERAVDTAPRTRRQETGQWWSLEALRDDFRRDFGRSMDEAVGLLMEAAFRGSWPAGTVRARASKLKSLRSKGLRFRS